MQFKKTILDTIERCYAVTWLNENEVCFASEAIDGSCFTYQGSRYQNRQTVYEKKGGTMSIVPIPNQPNRFIAIEQFYPGFNASEATINWYEKQDNNYHLLKSMTIPYLHRFDLFLKDDQVYFLGGILCNSKKDRNDWSDPGRIVIGKLPDDLSQDIILTSIQEGLTHNHGYCRHHDAGYITSDEGVFKVTIDDNHQWHVEHLIKRPVSDIAICDIDNDGNEEMIIINDFHGNSLSILKPTSNSYEEIKTFENLEFIHALWAGNFDGINTIIVGARKGDADLFYIRYDGQDYQKHIIDHGVGPANIAIYQDKDKHLIASANHVLNQPTIYTLMKE